MYERFFFTMLAAVIALPAAGQQPAQAPTVVTQAAVERAVSTQADFIGRIEAVAKVDVQARVTGFLGAPQFREGDQVKAGQILFTIEKDSYLANVAAKEAQLASAKAEETNTSLAYDRTADLVKTNAATKATLDQRKADLSKAEAAVLMAQAALDDAKITLSYTDIKSPINGRIGSIALTEGNLVSPSSGALATIVRDDEVRALFSVSQREVLIFKRAASTSRPSVMLKLADNSIYPEKGVIDFINVVVDSRTDGQEVRATFANGRRLLVHGQTVRVTVEQPAEAPVVVVPQNALAADMGGPFVLIVDANQQVVVRHVKIGQGRDGITPVLEGLKAGENVIVQGQQRARPGIKVNAQPAPALK